MPVDVVAAVIERDGRLLVCQRPAHKRHGGLYEFPGGKLEVGETLLAAARRELAEELDVLVTSVGAVRLALRDPGSEFVIKFADVAIEGEPRAIEHADLAWVTPDRLLALPLAPSDRRFAEHLTSHEDRA